MILFTLLASVILSTSPSYAADKEKEELKAASYSDMVACKKSFLKYGFTDKGILGVCKYAEVTAAAEEMASCASEYKKDLKDSKLADSIFINGCFNKSARQLRKPVTTCTLYLRDRTGLDTKTLLNDCVTGAHKIYKDVGDCTSDYYAVTGGEIQKLYNLCKQSPFIRGARKSILGCVQSIAEQLEDSEPLALELCATDQKAWANADIIGACAIKLKEGLPATADSSLKACANDKVRELDGEVYGGCEINFRKKLDKKNAQIIYGRCEDEDFRKDIANKDSKVVSCAKSFSTLAEDFEKRIGANIKVFRATAFNKCTERKENWEKHEDWKECTELYLKETPAAPLEALHNCMPNQPWHVKYKDVVECTKKAIGDNKDTSYEEFTKIRYKCTGAAEPKTEAKPEVKKESKPEPKAEVKPEPKETKSAPAPAVTPKAKGSKK